nr:hypothetical protein [Tanacetum cinerariifolium]
MSIFAVIFQLAEKAVDACFRDELDNVVEEEDGGWIFFLGGNNSLGTKKYQGSNSGDGGNIGDGVKITGRVIGFGGGIGEARGDMEKLGDELSRLKLGGVENTSLVGSKLMDSGEECLDGWVEAGGGEVKGGGVVFGVSRIEFVTILEDNTGESGAEAFGLDREAS